MRKERHHVESCQTGFMHNTIQLGVLRSNQFTRYHFKTIFGGMHNVYSIRYFILHNDGQTGHLLIIEWRMFTRYSILCLFRKRLKNYEKWAINLINSKLQIKYYNEMTKFKSA